jgi:hypothetical protein
MINCGRKSDTPPNIEASRLYVLIPGIVGVQIGSIAIDLQSKWRRSRMIGKNNISKIPANKKLFMKIS